MLVFLRRDALHVDARRRQVFMVERILHFNQAARVFRYHARKGVATLMQMDVADARRLRIPFQVVDKCVRGERHRDFALTIMSNP